MYGKYECFVKQMLYVHCVHPVAVLNDALCMACSLLMLMLFLYEILHTM